MPKAADVLLDPILLVDANSEPDVKKCREHEHEGGESSMDELRVSIEKDARAAAALARSLDLKMVRKFVDIIDHCDGTLITSGVGMYCFCIFQ